MSIILSNNDMKSIHLNMFSECFVSVSEVDPWMAVDLLAERAISTVVILSKDLAGDRDSLFS